MGKTRILIEMLLGMGDRRLRMSRSVTWVIEQVLSEGFDGLVH